MTDDGIGIGLYVLLGVLGSLGVTAGYLLGLRRFESRRKAELDAVQLEVAQLAEAHVAVERARVLDREEAERALAEIQQKAQEEREIAARARDSVRTTADRAVAAEAAVALVERQAQEEREAARRTRDSERMTAERAIAEAHQKVQAAALQRAPIPMVTHTVLLDGVSKSGKSTLVHRLAFPCTEQQSLEKLTATDKAYQTRVLPICFIPPYAGAGSTTDGSATPVLHAQIIRDVSGEKTHEIVDSFIDLAAERGKPVGADRGPAAVICVLVWDMADPMTTRRRITREWLQLVYHNKNARGLIKHFIFFFNKVDLLEVSAERLRQLIADERAYIESVTNFFDSDVNRTYISGSALRGDGVIECQGAIYTALGLAEHFRVGDREGKAP